MYCDKSSLPAVSPFSPLRALGSHTAVTRRSWFGPGTTEIFLAVACPRIVPLLSRLMFTYGTVAEYSVGFVTFILACIASVEAVVSKISKDPTFGEKPARWPPDIAN
jgi:hypothetical protein